MTVARLVKSGHAVRVIGRRAGVAVEGAEYLPCDITNLPCLADLAQGMDAVVHLAAISNPASGTGPDIFQVNCAGTYNVYSAAAQRGIRRVVQASSINALGYNYGVVGFPLSWFPVDEEHPTHTTDPYSFSKQIVEEIADYFWRREGISGASLRLPWVYEAGEGAPARSQEERDWFRRTVDAHQELLSLPEPDRSVRVKALEARYDSLRAAREFEKPFAEQGFWNDPDVGILVWRSNLWTSVDARDSAQAVEKALLADYEGSHPLFINDAENIVGLGSRGLAEVFYPEVTEWKKQLQGTESLVSIDAARRLIGYEPEHSFRQLM
jgi:nucleoside-diphosphate-sugar epimerase